MASQEEGEEARESEEGMTNFEPYVAGKVRVSLSMVSYSREGKQRGQGQNQQQQRSVATRDPSNEPPESGGISAARGLFRKIRSSLSQAVLLQQPPPPATTSRTSLTANTSGATKRPATVATKHSQQQQAVARKQPRLANPPSAKKAPQLLHPSSAPVLHKPAKGGIRSTAAVKVSPSRSSRDTSPPIKGGSGGPSSPREHSPLVIEDMASFGPGSGRRYRPPAQLLPSQSTNQEQVQSEQQRSKSEEPPSSPLWAELEAPRALDDTSKALNKAKPQSSSGEDAHQITLMSYSDVHRHRVAAKAATSKIAAGSGGGTSPNKGGSVHPPAVKKPLNKQDLLKRIGSIENDEVSKMWCSITDLTCTCSTVCVVR